MNAISRNTDLLCNILLFCRPDDVLQYRLVNSQWDRSITQPQVWHNLLVVQSIPRDFAFDFVPTRAAEHASPNLLPEQLKIIDQELYGHSTIETYTHKQIVSALQRLYFLWRTYNALYLLDNKNIDQKQGWNISMRVRVQDLNSITIVQGRIQINARVSDIHNVTLLLSQRASTEFCESIQQVERIEQVPQHKILQRFFQKESNRFVLHNFIQVVGTYQVGKPIQVDVFKLVETIPEPLPTRNTIAMDTMVTNSLHGIELDRFDYDQMYCGKLVTYRATVLRMIDTGRGWTIQVTPHVNGKPLPIYQTTPQVVEHHGFFSYISELRDAIFPPNGRELGGLSYILEQWKTAIRESNWIRRQVEPNKQLLNQEEEQLYGIYHLDNTRVLEVIHMDKTNAKQLYWPESIPRPTFLEGPLLRQLLIKPQDEINIRGRLLYGNKIIAYDVSLVKPKLYLLTNKDWLRLLVNASVIGTAIFVLYHRHGHVIRKGDWVRLVAGSYSKAMIQLQLVIVFFNVYMFGPDALNYVVSSLLPLPQQLVPSWLIAAQQYVWMGLFGYWAAKNVLFVDPNKATFIQKWSKSWLTNYGTYLAECYGYLFAADSGLRTLPVLFKLQRRVLLYIRQRFSMLKSKVATKLN